MGTLILQDILLIFLISIPVLLLLNRFKLPSLLGFIATGALIGPYGLGIIEDEEQINILAELGVTLLLFTVGLQFSWKSFQQLKRQGILSGLLQISLTIIAGTIIGLILNWPWHRGFYFGCLLALSSTAVVLTILSYRHQIESLTGKMMTAILILQDLALIPLMVILPLLGRWTWKEAIDPKLLTPVLAAALLSLFVFIFIRFLGRPLLGLIARAVSRELFVIAVISIALGMAWVTNLMGLSFALGAFLGGLMIGTTQYQYQALSDIKPFQFCFNSLFFVSIGMLFNFDFITQHSGLILLLIILIPLLKFFITSLSVYLNHLPLKLAMVVGISLGQVGEFSFLLAYLGDKSGAISPFFYQLIVAVAVLTMMITPFMVVHAPRIAGWILELPGIKKLKLKEEDVRLLKKSRPMKGHIIICGFGPLGQALGRILSHHKLPYLVLELNPTTIKRLHKENTEAFYGDGASEEILFASGIERARLLAITVPGFLENASIIKQARTMNPKITIITRAKFRNQVAGLYQAGADVVISEELEGGIEMGRYTLNSLGLSHQKADDFFKKIREFGSADFF